MKHNWKYKLAADHSYDVPWMPEHVCLSLPWLRICNGRATVRADYAWDGCSPSGLYWDTWDGPINPDTLKPLMYYPSLKHDAGYQYIYEIAEAIGRSVAWVRKRLDDDFLETGKKYGFAHARLYYRFVRALGWIPVWRRGRARR